MIKRLHLALVLGVTLMAMGSPHAALQLQAPAAVNPPLSIPEQPPSPPPSPALQNYLPVSADRLKRPQDGDWLMTRRTSTAGATVRSTRSTQEMFRAFSLCGRCRPA